MCITKNIPPFLNCDFGAHIFSNFLSAIRSSFTWPLGVHVGRRGTKKLQITLEPSLLFFHSLQSLSFIFSLTLSPTISLPTTTPLLYHLLPGGGRCFISFDTHMAVAAVVSLIRFR
ncbi:hypothetical protein QTP88_012952 [Uroleucon formosanum]